MKISRSARTQWRPPPRLEDNTAYMCTQCGWWWEHLAGDSWRGAYFADLSAPGGQRPAPGRGCGMTWDQLADSYSDCYGHLAPLDSRYLICPDCEVVAGNFHRAGCGRAVCRLSRMRAPDCARENNHRCYTLVWAGEPR